MILHYGSKGAARGLRRLGAVVCALAVLALFAGTASAGAADAQPKSLFADGTFRVGCNYWASHAGMMMWRNWDAAQVERDFAALAGNGVRALRVFPLWPDFQPLTRQYG